MDDFSILITSVATANSFGSDPTIATVIHGGMAYSSATDLVYRVNEEGPIQVGQTTVHRFAEIV